MNRKLTKEKLFELIKKLRAKIPGLAFRTSIIVGFPTETDAEFEELCQDLEKLALDYVGVFRYSREEGTLAGAMQAQVPNSTKRKREKKLIEILQNQALLNKQKYLHKMVPVMVEGTSLDIPSLIQGRMSTQAQEIDGHVIINDFDSEEDFAALLPGKIVQVKITEIMPHDLIGKLYAGAPHFT